MKMKFILSVLSVLCLCAGCGTSANLAGLSAQVNVAQKGMAAGLTLAAGTNQVSVGATYSQGTNSYGVQTTIPTN